MQRSALNIAAVAIVVAATSLLLPGTLSTPYELVAGPESTIWLAWSAAMLLSMASALCAHLRSLTCSLLLLVLALGIVARALASLPAVPSAVLSISAVTSLVASPGIVALTLVWPDGRLRSRTERLWTVWMWIFVAIASVLWVLVWDPFSDRMCRLNCGTNPLALSPQPDLARILADAALVGTVIGCAAAAQRCLRPSRFWPGALAALAVGVEAAGRVVIDLWRSGPALATLQVVRTSALGLLGAAIAVDSLRRLSRRRRFRRLAATLDAVEPGGYAVSLGEALGDPTLRIGYPIDGGTYAQASGRLFEGVEPGQRQTVVERSGQTVAVVSHQAALAGEVGDGLGPAAVLAMENERLQAELSRKLSDLRASRNRIVARADRERVRLERVMHDGAQQQLLVLAHHLSQALGEDRTIDQELVPVIEDVERVLGECRVIAHGIYPGLLETLGLSAAIDALTTEGAPFTFRAGAVGRMPPQVERTAYLLVVTLIGPSTSGSGPASVELGVIDETLVVSVDSRTLGRAELEELEDRVGALGGTLTIDGTHLMCQLPCA